MSRLLHAQRAAWSCRGVFPRMFRYRRLCPWRCAPRLGCSFSRVVQLWCACHVRVVPLLCLCGACVVARAPHQFHVRSSVGVCVCAFVRWCVGGGLTFARIDANTYAQTDYSHIGTFGGHVYSQLYLQTLRDIRLLPKCSRLYRPTFTSLDHSSKLQYRHAQTVWMTRDGNQGLALAPHDMSATTLSALWTGAVLPRLGRARAHYHTYVYLRCISRHVCYWQQLVMYVRVCLCLCIRRPRSSRSSSCSWHAWGCHAVVLTELCAYNQHEWFVVAAGRYKCSSALLMFFYSILPVYKQLELVY